MESLKITRTKEQGPLQVIPVWELNREAGSFAVWLCEEDTLVVSNVGVTPAAAVAYIGEIEDLGGVLLSTASVWTTAAHTAARSKLPESFDRWGVPVQAWPVAK